MGCEYSEIILRQDCDRARIDKTRVYLFVYLSFESNLQKKAVGI